MSREFSRLWGKKHRIGKDKGSSSIIAVIGVFAFLLVILPVLSFITENSILMLKASAIRDAADLAALSSVRSLDTQMLAGEKVQTQYNLLYDVYVQVLSDNLSLDDNLEPFPDSPASSRVRIESLSFCDEAPVPYIESVVIVPVKPVLAARILLSQGEIREYMLNVTVRTEIPVDN